MSNKLTKLYLLQPNSFEKIVSANMLLEKYLIPVFMRKDISNVNKWYNISQQLQRYITLNRKSVPSILKKIPVENMTNHTENVIENDINDNHYINDNSLQAIDVSHSNNDLNLSTQISLDHNIEGDDRTEEDNIEVGEKEASTSNATPMDISFAKNLKSLTMDDFDAVKTRNPGLQRIITAKAVARRVQRKNDDYDNMKIVKHGDSVYTVFGKELHDADEAELEKATRKRLHRTVKEITKTKRKSPPKKRKTKLNWDNIM